MKLKLDEISCISNRDDGDIGSLIEAIKATGERLLQPILLSKHSRGPKLYDVVDGRRRFQALYLMGRKELDPEEYVFVDDAVNSEVAAYIANTERKMLSPIEEAQQICELNRTMTIEEVAEKLGKTENYVAARCRLAELKGEWLEVLNHPEKYPHWTIGKLQLIAREPESIQSELAHLISDSRNFSTADLLSRIGCYHRKLADAPFAWQNICRVCEYRSDRQGVLFAEDTPDATCLNADCFKKLCFKAAVKKAEENPQLKMVRGGSSWGDEPTNYADKHNVPSYYSVDYKPVDDPEKANGIIVCGDNIGQLVKITADRSVVKTSADTAAEKAAEKAQKADTKKQRDIMRIAMAKFRDQIKVITRWEHLPPDMHEAVWFLICTLGLPGASWFMFSEKHYNLPENVSNWPDRLLELFIKSICTHIDNTITHPQLDVKRTFAKAVCKFLGWDWDTLFMEPARLEYAKNGGKVK